MSWGERGRGTWVTVPTNPGHAYLIVAGLRSQSAAAAGTAGRADALGQRLPRTPPTNSRKGRTMALIVLLLLLISAFAGLAVGRRRAVLPPAAAVIPCTVMGGVAPVGSPCSPPPAWPPGCTCTGWSPTPSRYLRLSSSRSIFRWSSRASRLVSLPPSFAASSVSSSASCRSSFERSSRSALELLGLLLHVLAGLIDVVLAARGKRKAESCCRREGGESARNRHGLSHTRKEAQPIHAVRSWVPWIPTRSHRSTHGYVTGSRARSSAPRRRGSGLACDRGG